MPDDLTPTDFLREAATLLRERAEAATPGPWLVYGHNAPDGAKWAFSAPNNENAAYLALMSPGVALALADWLDGTAGWCTPSLERQRLAIMAGLSVPPEHGRALPVAAVVLGREWTP